MFYTGKNKKNVNGWEVGKEKYLPRAGSPGNLWDVKYNIFIEWIEIIY